MVGKLLVHELELRGVKKAKGIALVSMEKQPEAESDEDNISLLVRHFDKVLKKLEKGKSQPRTGNGRKPMTRVKGARRHSVMSVKVMGISRLNFPLLKGEISHATSVEASDTHNRNVKVKRGWENR
ncbi:unnamed protein product [Microthlaspi erraticum]|uniref:Uncharacterized protein n=1 Tax=Microthlaspi erraticum TaxID=1685480 RepID=A0A6D2JKN0_9BRAS|nr:unnamed protein product [Microthlaspi erraticum]